MLPQEHPNWCWAVIVVLVIYILYVGGHLPGFSKESLDNRPRWMMGGLRDDTGSHNAKDVFGMGFGLDQTRVGTQTADGVYNVQLGKASMPLLGKVQTEYGGVLGDP